MSKATPQARAAAWVVLALGLSAMGSWKPLELRPFPRSGSMQVEPDTDSKGADDPRCVFSMRLARGAKLR